MALVTPFSKVLATGVVVRPGGQKRRTRVVARARARARAVQTFTLLDLTYDYGAREPHISGEIMQIHRQKHRQAYVNNYNEALEQLDDALVTGDSAKIVGLQGAIKFNGGGRWSRLVSFAIPESAATTVVAAVVVGAAATLLLKTSKAPETEIALKPCEDCNGSGLCPECNGEGFVLKKLTDESAERARMMAKDAATRYTAGLPKKWTYCSKCNSTRSCRTCDGRGKVDI